MGVPLNLQDIQSGFLSASAFNQNNTLTEAALAKTLNRTSNSVDNAMEVDLDMGLNKIFNLGEAFLGNEAVTLSQLQRTILESSSGLIARLRETRKVATAGQTVVNLADITYTPGVNNLMVYVNGVAQVAGIDYAETDSTTITFSSDLQAGDLLDIYTNEATTNNDMDAQNVSYGQSSNVDTALDERVIYVGSVAELRNQLDIKGDIQLLGYYASGDGGGGDLYVDEADTTTEDNGITVFVTAAGKRVKRFGDKVTVLQAGIKKLDDPSQTRALLQKAVYVTSFEKIKLLGVEGTFYVDDTIYIGTDTFIQGVLGFKIIANTWAGSDFRVICASRVPEDSNFTAPHKKIHLEQIYVEGADKTASRSNAAIALSYCEDVNLIDVEVIDGSDACIRVDGYGAGAFTNDTNSSFWNNSKNIKIIRPKTRGGFLGIELEGGVEDVKITDPDLDGAVSHALRIPSAYSVKVKGGRCAGQGRGVWLDRHKEVSFTNVDIEATGEGASSHAISLGGFDTSDPNDSGQVSIGTKFIGCNVTAGGGQALVDDFQGSATKYCTGLIFIGNNIKKGTVFFTHTENFTCIGNTGLAGTTIGPWASSKAGVIKDNFLNLRFDSGGYQRAKSKGGGVFVSGNINPDTGELSRPEIQSILGTSNESFDGEAVLGATIFNSLPSRSRPYAGYICTTAGNPGKFSGFGEYHDEAEYVKKFIKTESNLGVTIDTISLENKSQFFMVEVTAVMSRAPSGDIGASRIAKAVFSVVREPDASAQVDKLTGVGEYDVATPTYGGSRTAGAINISASISGSATAEQTLNLTMDYTNFLTGHAQIRAYANNNTVFAK